MSAAVVKGFSIAAARGSRGGEPMVFASYSDAAALIGRVALGALFLTHGWPKIKDIRKPIGFVKGTGWPGGAAFAALFSLLEFFAALALVVALLGPGAWSLDRLLGWV